MKLSTCESSLDVRIGRIVKMNAHSSISKLLLTPKIRRQAMRNERRRLKKYSFSKATLFYLVSKIWQLDDKNAIIFA